MAKNLLAVGLGQTVSVNGETFIIVGVDAVGVSDPNAFIHGILTLEARGGEKKITLEFERIADTSNSIGLLLEMMRL